MQVFELNCKSAVALEVNGKRGVVVVHELDVIILVKRRVSQRPQGESEQDHPENQRRQQSAAAAKLRAILILLPVVEQNVEAELVKLS